MRFDGIVTFTTAFLPVDLGAAAEISSSQPEIEAKRGKSLNELGSVEIERADFFECGANVSDFDYFGASNVGRKERLIAYVIDNPRDTFGFPMDPTYGPTGEKWDSLATCHCNAVVNVLLDLIAI